MNRPKLLGLGFVLACASCNFSNPKEGGPCHYENLDARANVTDTGIYLLNLSPQIHPFWQNGLRKDVTSLFSNHDQELLKEKMDTTYDVRISMITEGTCTPISLSLRRESH